jgi:1-acyl-sn-glycerol-3-phosphate acyltransferase
MFVMRWGFGWRIEGMRETRLEYQRLRCESRSPLLVCANHLTMLDSFLVAAALGSPAWFVLHYASLPWNTPEREHFANTWWKRALVFLVKCIPVERGGDRREVGRTLPHVTYLLARREVALIFPEGGRSRTGRVDRGALTYGVGRIVKSLPGCSVLCVYLRGDHQQSYSARPVRGERFRVAVESFEPKTERAGLTGSVEITRQILARLAEMERRYLDGRQ